MQKTYVTRLSVQFFEDESDATIPCGKVAKLCKQLAHSGELNSYVELFKLLSGHGKLEVCPKVRKRNSEGAQHSIASFLPPQVRLSLWSSAEHRVRSACQDAEGPGLRGCPERCPTSRAHGSSAVSGRG